MEKGNVQRLKEKKWVEKESLTSRRVTDWIGLKANSLDWIKERPMVPYLSEGRPMIPYPYAAELPYSYAAESPYPFATKLPYAICATKAPYWIVRTYLRVATHS